MPRNPEQSERMRAESQAALLEAARTLFAENGYYQTTVSEVAQAAQMSQGNVYWYFSSKEELLQAVLADGFEAMRQMLQEAAALPLPALEKLKSLLRAQIEFSKAGSQFVTILLAMLSHGGSPLMQSLGFDMDRIGEAYHQSLSSILTQAQEEGLLPHQPPAETLTFFYFALFNGLIVTYGSEIFELPQQLLEGVALRMLGIPDIHLTEPEKEIET
jgi:AcrR family transcriptional regulator